MNASNCNHPSNEKYDRPTPSEKQAAARPADLGNADLLYGNFWGDDGSEPANARTTNAFKVEGAAAHAMRMSSPADPCPWYTTFDVVRSNMKN